MPKSVVAGSCRGTIWINVGTATGQGVVNYRAPGSGVQGASECVLQRQAEILAHIFDAWDCPGAEGGPPSGELEVTICLDADFKPDDAVAAFLVLHLLEHGSLPRCAAALAAYMAWARRSSEPYFPESVRDGSPDPIRRFLSALATGESLPSNHRVTFGFAIQCRNWALRKGSPPSPGPDLASVLGGLVLMCRAAAAFLDHRATRQASKPWADFPKDANGVDENLEPDWVGAMPGDLAGEIRAAAAAVLDASESMDPHVRTGRLPIGSDMRDEERVRVMVVSARGVKSGGKSGPDVHTTQLTRICIGAGLFDGMLDGAAAVLVLHGDSPGGGRWFDISLTADRRNSRARSLRGLGRALEELEQERRATDRDARRALSGRFADIPGIADPWYDGRDHDFGIVGGPFSGSELTVDDVERLIDSAYWKPRVSRARAWTVSEARGAQGVGLATSREELRTNVYRKRWPSEAVPSSEGSERWSFVDAERSPELRTRDFVLEAAEDFVPAGRATLRADAGLLAAKASIASDEAFRVALLELLAPPFASAERGTSVDDCVPDFVRDQFRREFCGPIWRTVELDADSEADVGSEGMVVWQRPGAAQDGQELGRSLALVAMDMLAYRSDLHRLLGAASQLSVLDSASKTFLMRWWNGRSAATYLIRFVDIVKNYRPERGRHDLRRVCDALDEVLAVPSTLARLERFLQFSDERERILRDGLLQVSLLLLAIPVLFQTPADLLQAWPVWQESGGIGFEDVSSYLWAIGRFVLSTLVIIVVGFLVIRAGLRRLPLLIRARRGDE